MHTQGQQFEIHVQSNSSTADEWQRAMEAPASDLPSLDDEQKEIAKRFGITEEEYARGELARIYGQQGLKARGARFGDVVQRVLSLLNPEYRVAAVFYEGGKQRWSVRFETPHGVRSVGVASEVADEIIARTQGKTTTK